MKHVYDPPVLHHKFDVGLPEASVGKIADKLNLSNSKKIILCDFVSKLLDELNHVNEEKVDSNYL